MTIRIEFNEAIPEALVWDSVWDRFYRNLLGLQKPLIGPEKGAPPYDFGQMHLTCKVRERRGVEGVYEVETAGVSLGSGSAPVLLSHIVSKRPNGGWVFSSSEHYACD